MYHSFKGLLSGAIFTGLLFLVSEPVDATGYDIAMPIEITNLHEDVTHIVVCAISSSSMTIWMQVGLGCTIATVSSDRSVNETLTIPMENHLDKNMFDAVKFGINLYPCDNTPITTDAEGIPLSGKDMFEQNVTEICKTVNSTSSPFSFIENWENAIHADLTTGHVFHVSDLVPADQEQ